MVVFKRAKFCKFSVAAALMASALYAMPLEKARAEPAQQSAAEILQDGLDALSDSQSDLAVQLFEQVIQSYPGSDESIRAERELGDMGVRLVPRPKADAPETAAGFVRRTPESEAALRMKFAREAGDRVFFAENSAVIGGRARVLIESQARWLAKRSDLKITVVGRADDSSPADAARELSAKRAEAVRDKLVASGIAPTRIVLDARGARDPVATCKSVLCQAQNRHVETVVSLGAGDQFGEGGAGHKPGQKTGQVYAPVRPAVDGDTVSR